MRSQELLHHLGLTDHESASYLAMLTLGPAPIAVIAKASGLHRPTLYQVLPSLERKGLVTHGPHGKRVWYTAESPQRIEQLIGILTEEVRRVLPELEHTYASRGKKPIVKFFEGRQGIQFVFDDLVRGAHRGEVFYRYSSPKGDLTKGEKYLPKDYRAIRDQKQLERFVITSEAVAKKKKPRMERAVKIVPPQYDLFEYGVTQLIYRDKIAFVDYNSETAFILENPTIARFQQKIFKLLFDKL